MTPPAPQIESLAPDRTIHRLKPLQQRPVGTLVIHEIYRSLQGESTHAGMPCVFVRLTACHLRCVYCDTPHAFHNGQPWTPAAVLDRVRELAQPGELVEVTGGEPLLQPEVHPLLTRLADAGFSVLLETSGACDIAGVDPRVRVILDLKTPASGEASRNYWPNLDRLRPTDEVKFVVCDRADFDWACRHIAEHRLTDRCPVLLSPAFGRVEPSDLAAWILASGLNIRLQFQLHKLLWGPNSRGV